MQLSVTLIIIIITCLVSFTAFSNQKIIDDLIFAPPLVAQRGQWYRAFSCGLIHADFGHLLFNMLTLYFFGPAVERGFEGIFGDGVGRWVYLLMYVTALAVSVIPTYQRHKNDWHYRSLGASGAVSAVLFAGLMISPGTEVFIFFIPIPIPGFIFAPLYLLISAWMDRRGGDNINHSAHIWGALYGLAFVIIGGRIAGYPVVAQAIEEIRFYLRIKGWIK